MKSLPAVHRYLQAMWKSTGHAVQIEILNNLAAAMAEVSSEFCPAVSGAPSCFATAGLVDRADSNFQKPRSDWPDCRPMVWTMVSVDRLGSLNTIKTRI